MIAFEDVGQVVARMGELEARVARLEAMADRSSASGAPAQQSMQLDLGRSAVRLGLRPGGALYVQPVFVRYVRPTSAVEAIEAVARGRMAFVCADQVEAALSGLRDAGFSVPAWTGGQQHV